MFYLVGTSWCSISSIFHCSLVVSSLKQNCLSHVRWFHLLSTVYLYRCHMQCFCETWANIQEGDGRLWSKDRWESVIFDKNNVTLHHRNVKVTSNVHQAAQHHCSSSWLDMHVWLWSLEHNTINLLITIVVKWWVSHWIIQQARVCLSQGWTIGLEFAEYSVWSSCQTGDHYNNPALNLYFLYPETWTRKTQTAYKLSFWIWSGASVQATPSLLTRCMMYVNTSLMSSGSHLLVTNLM